MGKLLSVNDNDDDEDSVADFADGFDCDEIADNEDDLNSAEADFRPMVLEIPAGCNVAVAKVRFTYSASPPAATPAEGKHLRIWTKNGNVARNKASVPTGDYVPDATAIPLADLGFQGGENPVRKITLFVEALREVSSGTINGRIVAQLDNDGDGNEDNEDPVRVTAAEFDLIAKEYAPYERLGGNKYSEVNEADEESGLTGWPLGPFVYINNNNSDNNKVNDVESKDLDDNEAKVKNEVDLRKIVLVVAAKFNTGTVTLERQDDKVRIWSDKEKGAAAKVLFGQTNSKVWNLANRANAGELDSKMDSLYVEGVSYGTCDITVILKDQAGVELKRDVLKFTVCPGEPLELPDWKTMSLVMAGGQVHSQWLHFSKLDPAAEYQIYVDTTDQGENPFRNNIPREGAPPGVPRAPTTTIKKSDWETGAYTAWDKGYCPNADKNLGAFYIHFPQDAHEGKKYWVLVRAVAGGQTSPNVKAYQIVVDYPKLPAANPGRASLAALNVYVSDCAISDNVFLTEGTSTTCGRCGQTGAKVEEATMWRVARGQRKQGEDGTIGLYYSDTDVNLSALKDASEGENGIFKKNKDEFGDWTDCDNNNKFFVFVTPLFGYMRGYSYDWKDTKDPHGGRVGEGLPPWERDYKIHPFFNKSNYSDLFYMNSGNFNVESSKGTMAHELQHNIHFRADGNNENPLNNEEVWLNEGCSLHAQDINGKPRVATGIDDFAVKRHMAKMTVFNEKEVFNTFGVCPRCRRDSQGHADDTGEDILYANYEKADLWFRYLSDNLKNFHRPDKSIKTLVQDPVNGISSINNLLKGDYDMLLNPDPTGYNAMDEAKCRPFIDWTIANFANRLSGNTNKRYKYTGEVYGAVSISVVVDAGKYTIPGQAEQPSTSAFWGLTGYYIIYSHHAAPEEDKGKLVVTLENIADFSKIAVNAVRINEDGTFKDVKALKGIPGPGENPTKYSYTVPGLFRNDAGDDKYKEVVIVVTNLSETGGRDEFTITATNTPPGP